MLQYSLQWLDALGLSLPIKENARVCSIHFCKEDFVGVEGYASLKPKLKSDAVPSLLLFNDPTFSKKRKVATATVIPQLVAPILFVVQNYIVTHSVLVQILTILCALLLSFLSEPKTKDIGTHYIAQVTSSDVAIQCDLVEQCDVSTQADMFLDCSSPLQQESEYKGAVDSVKLQKEYLFPVIHTAYVHQQEALIAFLEGKHLYLSGDGRCDSPGYSAKYCTYSLMDNATDLILDYSLVQVTETGCSVTMEKEGLERCLTNVLAKDVLVKSITTDRHTGVSALLKRKYPTIDDVWHLAKSIVKKQEKQKNHLNISQNKENLVTSGHMGKTRTVYSIKERFMWHGMVKDVVNLLSKCDVCQRMNRKLNTGVPELHPIPVKAPWYMVGIDFVFMRMGLPCVLLSDNGSEFCNELNDQLAKMLGIKRRLTTPYHPQANGLDERFNQSLQNMLVKARLPIDVELEHQDSEDLFKAYKNLEDRPYAAAFDGHAHILAEAKGNIIAAQLRQKKAYDKKHCKPGQFQCDQLVLLKNFKRQKVKVGKLMERHLGPYTITNMCYHTVESEADLDGRESKADLDGRESEANLDRRESEADLDGRESEADLDGRESEANLDGRELEADLDGRESEANLDGRESEADLDGRESEADLDEEIDLDQATMRNHLVVCFTARKFTPFTTKKVKRACSNRIINIDVFCTCQMPASYGDHGAVWCV
eukprot:Em0001g1289a